jgi:hypothetical protein
MEASADTMLPPMITVLINTGIEKRPAAPDTTTEFKRKLLQECPDLLTGS